MISAPPILIIGAGIGGLTLALGLQRAGFRVIVAERASTLGEIGAGLTIGPNATRGLESLGLGDALRYQGDPSSSSLVGLHYRTGEALYPRLVSGFKKTYGADLYQFHRADLHGILAAAVRRNDPGAIRTSQGFVGLQQQDDLVHATLENGETLCGSALIGCDGLRSRVRAVLFEPQHPRFTGQVAFRGLAPTAAASGFLSASPAAAYMGPGRTFTHYPVRHGAVVNFVGIARTEDWREEGWNYPAGVEETLAQFEGWHPNVHGLIRSAGSTLTKWALFDREPLMQWSVHRATLLGDAAHPMLPFLGMGAAMAIEDAVVLARCVAAAANPIEAFARYERARVERTRSVLLNSRLQGETMQSSRPELLGAADGQGEVRLGLFDYDPVTTPV